ncbi:MAG: hypothetical protein EA378_10920 [Phycisphaerales bacterium]|nr:MAG: hypothetical protein EA378_10920 [Phycisphaerales bacterium]
MLTWSWPPWIERAPPEASPKRALLVVPAKVPRVPLFWLGVPATVLIAMLVVSRPAPASEGKPVPSKPLRLPRPPPLPGVLSLKFQ